MPKSTDSVINKLNALNLCTICLTGGNRENMSYHYLIKGHVAVVICGTSFITYEMDHALINDYEVKQDDPIERPFMLKATEKMLNNFPAYEREFMTTKAAIEDCCNNGTEYATPNYTRSKHKFFRVGKNTDTINARLMKKYLPFFSSRMPIKVSIHKDGRFVFSQNNIHVCIIGNIGKTSNIILEK